jgi:hypothetical protein
MARKPHLEFFPVDACRPPGVYHGPFKSEKGCVLFEIHYYRPEET